MAINPGFTLVCSNLGMGCDAITLIVINIGLLVFLAKDWKLGISMGFLINGAAFMWFYHLTVNKGYTFSWFGIAVMLVSLIFASLGAGTWYIVLLQVIEAILLMWIGVLMYNQNTPEVA